MAGKQKQTTLAFCGFTKSVVTKGGKLYQVTLPEVVYEENKHQQQAECTICKQTFSASKYLKQHWIFKHPKLNFPEVENSSSDLSKLNPVRPVCDDVVNSVPDQDASIILLQASPVSSKKDRGRCGQRHRKTYTLDFKLKAIKMVEQAMTRTFKKKAPMNFVASELGVNKALISKWYKERIRLIDYRDANVGSSKTPCRIKRNIETIRSCAKNTRYPLAESMLLEEYKQQRSKGLKVTKHWLRKKMKCALKEKYGEDVANKFQGSKNWLYRFTKRNGISKRRRTNKKQQTSIEKIVVIQEFHRELRKAVQSKRRRSPSFDKKWGRWLPTNRWNVDQVPLPFINEQETTYADKGSRAVWVAQPSSGLDKRQATLQLMIRAEGEQTVKPTVVFRGAGKVSSAEVEEYDKRVHVLFQKNAWMDEATNMKWVNEVLIPGISDKKNENILFADNVSFQLLEGFHQVCRKKANMIVYMLPPNQTDKVQPIDQGEGYLMKKKIGECLDSWLENEKNLEEWNSTISAKKRRVLLTRWVGEAWQDLNQKYASTRRKLVLKTGCLMTADGTDDDEIMPQGIENYNF